MKRGSAAWVVRAARDWAATVGRGLGLVSYLSLGERDRAISAFKAECAKGGLTTATLSARAESGRAFLEAIRGATANVLLVLDPEVLIYGNEPDRSPAWLNFHRESIIEFPGPQIWWMPEQAATLLGRDLPDLGRFFLFREELTEIDTTTAVPEKRTLDAPLSGAENGGEVLLARALRAAESGADPARIWLELGVPAIRALLDSSQRNQALSAMDSLTARIGPPEVIRSWAEANSDPAARLKGDQDAPGRERLAQALLQAGRLFQDLYRQEEARSFMLEALPIFREVGDRLGEANCIMSLGDIALRRSDHEQARLRFLEALPIYREVGDRLGEANCIKSLGNIALDRSDHEQARLRFLEALPIYREFGDRLGE
ncbi:MAG: tetratricopeptide repeat protein, partial [Bryobacteraceae bacterium]|nr:tetratricopeptide repeat protein [Bryobacteraceae bacterium]